MEASASQGIQGKDREVQGLSSQRLQEIEEPWDESDLIPEKQHNPSPPPPREAIPSPSPLFLLPLLVR